MVADLMERLPTPMKSSELAKKLGVSPSYVSQLFSGDKLINYPTLAKLQRIFNIRFKLDIKNKEIRKSVEPKYYIAIQKSRIRANNNIEETIYVYGSPSSYLNQLNQNEEANYSYN